MVYYTSRATLRVSLKILFAGYENKLFVKVLLNLFLGFITLKHCKINFCNTCAFFCMFLLKTVKFYKFEIAIYLHYCGRNFCRSKSQVNRKFQHSWRRISFLQKSLWFTRTKNNYWNKLNEFLPQNNYLRYWIAEINTEKFLFPTIPSLWEIIFLTFFLWCYWQCDHSTTKIWRNRKYKIRKLK